jgi:DNA-directed RNA polymerase specialized sigma24 family protein
MPDGVDLERVRLATRGGAGAFAELYELGFRRVWAFAARAGRSQEAAEHLTEAILTRAFESLGSFDGTETWCAWLGAIACQVREEVEASRDLKRISSV